MHLIANYISSSNMQLNVLYLSYFLTYAPLKRHTLIQKILVNDCLFAVLLVFLFRNYINQVVDGISFGSNKANEVMCCYNKRQRDHIIIMLFKTGNVHNVYFIRFICQFCS